MNELLSFLAFIVIVNVVVFIVKIPKRKRRNRIYDIADEIEKVFSLVRSSNSLKKSIMQSVKYEVLDDNNEARILHVADDAGQTTAATCFAALETLRKLSRQRNYQVNHLTEFVEVVHYVQRWAALHTKLDRNFLNDNRVLIFSDLPKNAELWDLSFSKTDKWKTEITQSRQ